MSDFIEGLISIIIPVYNAEKYIGQTMHTVLAQTCRNWELILVDDLSTDHSREVIEQEIEQWNAAKEEDLQKNTEAGSVRLICKEHNEGAARARNTGIDQAKGRYLAFLDADDLWMPEKLDKELAFLKKKRAAFAFTAYEFGDEEARGTGRVVRVPEELGYRRALSRTIIFTTTVMFDRSRLTKELLYMPDVKSEDTATWWQILRTGCVAYGLDEVLAVYRRPRASLSSNKFAAMKRIWNLYRKQEQLSVIVSGYYFIAWAVRATCRRI